MLHDIRKLIGREVYGSDDKIGEVEDCLFDDERWAIRYLVIDPGGWLEGNRRILLAPSAFGSFGWTEQKGDHLAVPFSRDKLRNSPAYTGERGFTRERERDLLKYYGWSEYWEVAGPTGVTSETISATTRRGMGQAESSMLADKEDLRPSGKFALRPINKVIGYHVQATDGEIGHIDNFFVDDATWRIRYAQVDTSNMPGGKPVLLATDWFDRVDWDKKKVFVNMTRESIKNSPKFDPKNINRDYENRLYDYYRRPGYWRAA